MPEYSHVWQTYIENGIFEYPGLNKGCYGMMPDKPINTGWQVIPSYLFRHFLTPKDWYDFTISHETIQVDGFSTTIFDLIPMTTQISFQQTQAFTAFNNCIYAWIYQDNAFETPVFNWYKAETDDEFRLNLAWKEGIYWPRSNNTPKRLRLPKYAYSPPRPYPKETGSLANMNDMDSAVLKDTTKQVGQAVWPFPQTKDGENYLLPSGLFWDPLNNPKEVLELRPGKNSVTVSWTNPEPKEFNVDALRSLAGSTCTGPYNGKARPETYKRATACDPCELTSQYEFAGQTKEFMVNDYTIPQWADQPIQPAGWAWVELKNQIAQDMNFRFTDFWFTGTEYENTKTPSPQTFIKLCPLMDDKDSLLPLTAIVSIKQTLKLSGKPRQSNLYAPTWGPFNWKSLYSCHYLDTRFALPTIRERQTGVRRSWQNMRSSLYQTGDGTPGGQWVYREWQIAHARKQGYLWNENQSAPAQNPDEWNGQGSSRYKTTTTGVQGTYSVLDREPPEAISITINKDLDREINITPHTGVF